MNERTLSPLDHFISGIDKSLKTLTQGAHQSQRTIETEDDENTVPCTISDEQQSHIAGLMRINHTGEVCAQALYQGQALTAKREDIRAEMEQAALEEIDHLVWCEQRLNELNSRPSIFNPLFYGMSFTVGAVAGAISDKISLGFVAATEEQVCLHLSDHLEQIPKEDVKTRNILQQMLIDEASHATIALESGAMEFHSSIKTGMGLVAKVMTKTTYYL